MKIAIHQFVGVTSETNILEGYGPVIKLGIQGPPGTEFYLNNSPFSSRIGMHSIYELDLSCVGGQIYNLKFNTPSPDIIVDIMYYEVSAK